MVDVNTGNSITRGAPGYHLESLPDGQQVLVNDRTGMVAITDPYTGQIKGEVPKSQVPGAGVTGKPGASSPGVGVPNQGQQTTPNGPVQYPPGVTNSQPSSVYKPGVYVPGGGGTQQNSPSGPVQYPPGVTNSGGAQGGTGYPPGVVGGQTPGGGAPPPGTQRPAGGPEAAGGTDPNAVITSGPTTAAGGNAPTGRPPVGTSGYDLWAMNDMLRDNRMDGWRVTGVVPIQQVKTVKNPDTLDLENPTIQQKQNEYIINAMDPSTGNVRTLTFAKVWQGANGQYTDQDPGDGSGYGYQLGDVKEQIKADPNSKGHTGQMTIGDTLWGTNAATGQFEPVPGAPKIPKGYTDVKQVKDKDGNTVWYGVNPVTQKLEPVPDMPIVPKEAAGYDNAQLIDDGTGTGNKVWYGVNPVTKKLEPIPDMPKVVAGPKGPGSVTQNGQVFIQKPDGSYEPAKGIPDPNPPAGTTQLILGPDGFIYRQVSRGSGQGFDPDTTFTPVAFTDAAKQSQANTQSHHKAGEPGTKVINDMVYHVTYRGDSNDSYDIDTNQPATRMPGTGTPTSIATGSDQPFIVQRMPDGSIGQVKNPNYQPTDPAKQVADLSAQANAKLQELHGKIGTGGYTQDQAQADFNQWWDSNVEPAKQQIQWAQQKQQQDLARSNLQVAQNAGASAVTAAAGEHRVGPGFGQMMENISKSFETGQFPKAMSAADWNNALVSEAPDYGQIYDQATARALAHISPAAAAQVNGGAPSALQGPMDITGQLNRNLPQFSMGPQPAPAGAPAQGGAPTHDQLVQMAVDKAVGGGGAPPGTDFTSTFARLNQDKAEQARQARFPGVQPPTPGLYNPYYQQGSAAGQPAMGPIAGAGIPSRPDLAVAGPQQWGLSDQAGWGPQYGLNLYDLQDYRPGPYVPV